MKKIFVLLFSLILSSFVESNEIKPFERLLTGNWYRSLRPENTVLKQYNWGEGEIVINFALEIDLYGNNKYIRLPMIGGPFKITEIIEVEQDQYILSFFFNRGNFEVTYCIHYNKENDSIWFDLVTDKELSLIPTGSDFLWYKISGPLSE